MTGFFISRLKASGSFLGPVWLFCLSFSSALASEKENSSGLPQFKTEWFPSQIFWLAVTFTVLYVFFSRYALPRIQTGIENRQKSIQNNLDSAADLSSRAKGIRENYERSMARAKERAAEAMRKADSELKQKTSDTLYSYRTKFTQEIAHIESELSTLRHQLMPEMQSVAAEVAAHATSTILHTPADLDEAQNIVDHLARNQKAA